MTVPLVPNSVEPSAQSSPKAAAATAAAAAASGANTTVQLPASPAPAPVTATVAPLPNSAATPAPVTVELPASPAPAPVTAHSEEGSKAAASSAAAAVAQTVEKKQDGGDGDTADDENSVGEAVVCDEKKTRASKKVTDMKALLKALGKKSVKDAEKEAHIAEFLDIRKDAIQELKQKKGGNPPPYKGEDWQPKLDGIRDSIPVTRHRFSVLDMNLLEPLPCMLQNWGLPSVIMRSVSVNLDSDGAGARAPVVYHCEYLPDEPEFPLCQGAYLAPSLEFFYTPEQLYRSWVGFPGLKKADVETYGFYSVGDIISIPGNNGKLHPDDSLNRFLVLGVIAHAKVVPGEKPGEVSQSIPNPDRVMLILKRLIGELPELNASTFLHTKIELLEWQLEHAASLIWHCEM